MKQEEISKKARTTAFELFKKTGSINYYLFYRKLGE